MTAPQTWPIEDGVLAFKVVDKAAVGYLPSWNAPAGKTSDSVTMADYETGSDTWRCQVTSGMLTPTADTTTQDIAPTFCQAGSTVPTPRQSTWTLDVEFFQDPHVGPSPTGLLQYCYEHDVEEVYFLLGLNGTDDPPRAVGVIRMSPGQFGGAAREALIATASWPTTQKPDIAWGVTSAVA